MPSRTRRWVLGAIGAVGTAGVAALVLDRPRGCPDGELDGSVGSWPQAGAGPDHAAASDWSVLDDLGVRWCYPAADDESRLYASDPAIADGTVYLPVGGRDPPDGYRTELDALSARTGDRYWRTTLAGEVQGTPAVAGDALVVVTKTDLHEGRVVALDRADGSVLWRVEVDARVTAPPAVVDGVTYVGDWNGTVRALAVADGSERWRTRLLDGDLAATFWSPVAVADGTVLAATRSGTAAVYALDAADGSERWRWTERGMTVGPVVRDGLVLGTDFDGAFALDARTGAFRWSAWMDHPREIAPTVGPSHAFVVDNLGQDEPYRLRALSLADGTESWSVDFVDPVGRSVVAGETVLVPERGRLAAYDRTDGSRRWRMRFDGPHQPVAVDGALFLPTGERLYALAATDGFG